MCVLFSDSVYMITFKCLDFPRTVTPASSQGLNCSITFLNQ